MEICAKICKSCPFKKKSAPGWLGPHTVDSIMEIMRTESIFACHLTIQEKTSEFDIVNGKIPICRGYIASATKSHKLFGSTMAGKLLRNMQWDIEQKDVEQVMNRQEFREHHNRYKIEIDDHE